MRRFGRICTSFSTSVVLPVPDGADTMKSRPQLWALPAACSRGDDTASLDILHLFAHPLELRFRLDDQLGHVEPVRLRTDGVDLAVHFLEKKIELAPARL